MESNIGCKWRNLNVEENSFQMFECKGTKQELSSVYISVGFHWFSFFALQNAHLQCYTLCGERMSWMFYFSIVNDICSFSVWLCEVFFRPKLKLRISFLNQQMKQLPNRIKSFWILRLSSRIFCRCLFCVHWRYYVVRKDVSLVSLRHTSLLSVGLWFFNEPLFKFWFEISLILWMSGSSLLTVDIVIPRCG